MGDSFETGGGGKINFVEYFSICKSFAILAIQMQISTLKVNFHATQFHLKYYQVLSGSDT